MLFHEKKNFFHRKAYQAVEQAAQESGWIINPGGT